MMYRTSYERFYDLRAPYSTKSISIYAYKRRPCHNNHCFLGPLFIENLLRVHSLLLHLFVPKNLNLFKSMYARPCLVKRKQ